MTGNYRLFSYELTPSEALARNSHETEREELEAEQRRNPNMFRDPVSLWEQLAVDSLRNRTNHPFSGREVFHTDERRPLEPIKLAEVRNIGRGALVGANQKEKLRIAS